VEIARVTTRSDLEDFHRVLEVSLRADYVGLPAGPLAEWLPDLDGAEHAGHRTALYVARVDGEPVALLNLRYPTLDNLDVANLELIVHPDHRLRGHGRQLAEHALEAVRAEGRTRVFTPVASWPDRPPLGRRLLEEHGFRPVIEDTRRMLDLHEHPPAPTGAVADGYRVVQWCDAAPDELVDGLAYLTGRMTLDAPMGDMDYEPERWDAARYRAMEADVVSRNRVRVVSAAVHVSGAVAGLTEIAVSLPGQETAEQWNTIVDPDHRGHGLGLLLKRENHRFLVEQHPGVRYVNTWNAASNTFMIRVNELVGFRAMETWTEYQLDL
jgi:GNAT superfamily N-acetyltransferase